jgi:hypothetical protein
VTNIPAREDNLDRALAVTDYAHANHYAACLLKVIAENSCSQLRNAFQGACMEQSRGNPD